MIQVLKILFVAVAIFGIILGVINAVLAHKLHNSLALVGWIVSAIWATTAIHLCLS